VAARSKAWVCGLSLAVNVDSNPAEGMDICLLLVLCFVRYRSLRRADHSSRGVLPSMVCLTGCDRESSTVRRPWPAGTVAPSYKKNFSSGEHLIVGL